jgi:hypothetical protein
MYFISAGAVEVLVSGRRIRLEAGSYFGEMALLRGEQRAANVVALDFCQFLVLEHRDFYQFMARHCPYRGLHPAVLMVKPAEDGPRSDLAGPMNGTTERRVLGEGEVRPEVIVIVGIRRKDPAQMGFTKDDDVIEAFPADRADQSLRMPILPGRPWGRRVITNAHGSKTPGDGMTIVSIGTGTGPRIGIQKGPLCGGGLARARVAE